MVDHKKKIDDISKMLVAKTHIGTMTANHEMRRYVGLRSAEGLNLINLEKTWQKLMVAARIIVAVENPGDVIAIASRPYGNRAVLKFAQYTGCQAIAGRWTPGTLTNQITQKFMEPRLLIVTDPRTDLNAVKETFYSNIPVIALCDTDSDLKYVDVAIPCNNRSIESIALIYWMLAREVLTLRERIEDGQEWDVMPDIFFWRDPEEFKKIEQKEEVVQAPHADNNWGAAAAEWTAAAPQGGDWGAAEGAAGGGWAGSVPASGQWGATQDDSAKVNW